MPITERKFRDGGDRFFDDKEKFVQSEEIEKFCKNTLDKSFGTWLVVGRDNDETTVKELENGELLSGMVICNLGKPAKDKPSRLAMILMDVIDGVIDDDSEAEMFAEALLETMKQMHRVKKGLPLDDPEEKSKELKKLDALKGLLDTAISSFPTYEGKEKFLRSCLGSTVIAHVLDRGTDSAKKEMWESMEQATLGGTGGVANDSYDSINNFIDIVLKAIDEGKPASEIYQQLKNFRKSI